MRDTSKIYIFFKEIGQRPDEEGKEDTEAEALPVLAGRSSGV
jgi:hypothetical protein